MVKKESYSSVLIKNFVTPLKIVKEENMEISLSWLIVGF